MRQIVKIGEKLREGHALRGSDCENRDKSRKVAFLGTSGDEADGELHGPRTPLAAALEHDVDLRDVLSIFRSSVGAPDAHKTSS